ncbi:unnamed protein product [Rotaria socialis]|uniref:Uncharacterized protein n=1 Tax=Rotaria socialis TaxID=392032 RepID=A0A819V483_9BILA|nr:unnamed protein product [Rotaria socialis]CAF4103837.1 unnamed protein product [Rotaria socialis]
MSGGMFMNSSSSNESNSDDEKCNLPTTDLIFSENEKADEEPVVVIRRNISKLKRQQATTSLQSSLSIRNISSLDSIDNHAVNDDNDAILSDQMTIRNSHKTVDNNDHDINRTSFNESERTDSGIGRDSGSSWRLSSYSESFHYYQQQQQVDKQLDSESNDEHEHDDDGDDATTPIPQINVNSQSSEDSFENFRLQKASWLHVKHWLTVQRQHKVELASKRQWKRFWTCLKGSNLYLYNDYTDSKAKITINIIESLCCPLPEHPNRQHVFSLTTHTGDTYCFQSSDQVELNHWISSIHHFCSLKTNEKLLRISIKELEENIERENKMRKLGELQLNSSASQKIRLLISKQIDLWEKNLEAFHVDLFRNKCYLCALTNDRDLPNPKDLLSQASPTTKAVLNKFAAFTPCSFYTVIAARRRIDRQGSKYKSSSAAMKAHRHHHHHHQQQQQQQQTKCYLTTPTSSIDSIQSPTVADQTILQMVTCDSGPHMRTIVSINESASVGELLKRVADKLGLQIDDHFLYFHSTSSHGFVPSRNEKLNNLIYSSIEARRKIVYQITLNSQLNMSGIEIITELYREYSLQVIVSNVKKGSESERLGVKEGDEIVIVNNSIVQDLSLDTLDQYFSQIPIMLTIRSSRLIESMNDPNRKFDFSNAIIQNLICPPPPPRIERLSRQELRELIVPKPDSDGSNGLISSINNDSKENEQTSSSAALERLLKNVDEISRYCRPTTTILNTNTEQMNTIHPTPRIKALSSAQRLRKVIFELVETEKSYVQDMQRLLERYIEPLRDDAKLLPMDAIESLYVSVKSIHQLQQTFLKRLESNIPTEIVAYNAIHEFRDILVSIADTFLSYAQYFKLYSTFCAMHLRINRLLDIHQNNQHLKEFLAARNPRHQHSLSFESYLIKPVQRILKYPLLLQQMLTFSNSNETNSNEPVLCFEIIKLKQAIKMMNDIGEYMNGMQQLYEDFGQSFEYITKNYSEEHNKSLQLNLPDLYAYGELEWINMHLFLLGKHHQRLKAYCFVFRNGCLILVREQSNKKKPDLLSIQKGNKIISDRFIRFIPMEDVNVELIENDESKDNNIPTWQLIHTDSKTRLKTYFRFANKDAQTFIKTINNCISSIATTVEWRQNLYDRTITSIRNSEPSYLTKKPSSQRLSSSRSCHVLLTSNSRSLPRQSDHSRRSPSPIWKRRSTPIRKQLLSMNIRHKSIRNSTDC